MGTFSTKAASALEKVLKRGTLVQIRQLITTLERALDNEVQETAYIEKEADRILDVETYLDGSEVIDKGPLETNLTKNLDGPSITRAISTATSVLNLVNAKREAWLAEGKAEWEAGRMTKHIQYKEDVKHGPGVTPRQFPI